MHGQDSMVKFLSYSNGRAKDSFCHAVEVLQVRQVAEFQIEDSFCCDNRRHQVEVSKEEIARVLVVRSDRDGAGHVAAREDNSGF